MKVNLRGIFCLGIVLYGLGVVYVMQFNDIEFNKHALVSFRKVESKDCFDSVDYGLEKELQRSKVRECEGRHSITTYNFTHDSFLMNKKYKQPTAFRSSLWKSIQIDFNGMQIEKSIVSLKQDGMGHDPRYRMSPDRIVCHCHSLNKTGREMFNSFHARLDDMVFQCKGKRNVSEDIIHGNVIALSRKDDHNPFFQISLTLNSWIMMRVLKWKPSNTKLLYFDHGLPSPSDEFQNRLLSDEMGYYAPRMEGRVVEFESLLFAPFETTGPLMTHLNDEQLCMESRLVQDFKQYAFKRYNIVPMVKHATKVITIISRRNYVGRAIGRRWMNEKEIMINMIQKYPHFKIQSIDFTQINMEQQMRTMAQTNIAIGMHGAGMVNVLWMPLHAKVIELFPKKKKRWGYRNICQYTGCTYFEYRNGTDVGKKIHNQHKIIDPLEWQDYFQNIIQG